MGVMQRKKRRSGRVSGPDKGKKPPSTDMPMRTANWPGLPGGTQPRDRSGGDKKVTTHAKSVGI